MYIKLNIIASYIGLYGAHIMETDPHKASIYISLSLGYLALSSIYNYAKVYIENRI